MASPTVTPTAPHARIVHRARAGLAAVAAIVVPLATLLGVIACTAAPAGKVPSAVTIVTTATSAEPRSSLPDALAADLTTMAKDSKQPGGAAVRIVSSATGGTVISKDLTPLRSNGQVQHATADAERQIRSTITKVATTMANTTATSPGLNLLGLLDVASQLPGDIAVLSSGVATEAPMDLRTLGWQFKPAAVVDSVARQGALPHLEGRHVTFYGLGAVAGEQPRLLPANRDAVEQLWLQLCQRTGATCAIAHDAISTAPPIATLPVPVVEVPTSITEGGCPVWASFNDSVLHFAPESATLPANPDDALRPIVEAAARCNIQSIDVTGHIADTGSGRDDGDLSGQRARAVANRLVALGLSLQQVGTVIGKGASEPVIPNFTAGAFDESKAQQNRRVELAFHRAQ